MFDRLIEKLQASPKKIVFTEGHDPRILEAADRLKKGGFLTPILVGDVETVRAKAAEGGFDIEGLEILDPATYPDMDAMVEKMVELRKGKMTADDCRAALSKGNYFGTMLVQMGYADAKQIPYVAMVGESEIANGTVTLKNMATGEQSELSIEQLIDALK